jgi:hypothetical protein
MRKFGVLGTIVEALALVAAFDLSLKVFGGSRVIRLLNVYSRRAGESRTGTDADLLVSGLRAAYERATAIYPRHVECLPRSLTIFVMARRRGIPVVFHLSVRKVPFASHAWLELNGPLFSNETPLIKSLTTILTVPSC